MSLYGKLEVQQEALSPLVPLVSPLARQGWSDELGQMAGEQQAAGGSLSARSQAVPLKFPKINPEVVTAGHLKPLAQSPKTAQGKTAFSDPWSHDLHSGPDKSQRRWNLTLIITTSFPRSLVNMITPLNLSQAVKPLDQLAVQGSPGRCFII